MKARFSTSRRLHTLAEGSGPRGFTAHRPYTVALSDQAGEIMPFVLKSDRPATQHDGANPCSAQHTKTRS